MSDTNALREEHGRGSEDRWDRWCDGWSGDVSRRRWRGTAESDRLDAVGWAALLLWAAALLTADRLSLMDRFTWWDGWALFLIGAGTIVLAKIIVRTLSLNRRRSETIG
jgi:hypothetical protein